MRTLLTQVICGKNKDMIRLCLANALIPDNGTIRCRNGINIHRNLGDNCPALCGYQIWNPLKFRQLGTNFALKTIMFGTPPAERTTVLDYSEIKACMPFSKRWLNLGQAHKVFSILIRANK